jgi:predicted Zn-dependent peptidase
MEKSSGDIPRNTPHYSALPFRFPFFAILLALAFAFAGSAFAFDLAGRVKEFTLDNGMKVLFLERKGAPIFAAHIVFNVGSVDEEAGRTGAAHMLEHMLFKGTKRIGTLDWEKEKPLLEKVDALGDKLDKAIRNGADKKILDELKAEFDKAQEAQRKHIVSESYSKIYSAEGGVGHNAGTAKDTTIYMISLPSNKLELWAKLEADRLENPVLREYYSEREVVLEELRRTYENNAQGKLYERFLSTAFIAHPYRNPIIGWERDIARLPLPEVKKFLNTWYVPNNAVIAIVGDLDFAELKAVITKYFGPIPARPLPSRLISEEPEQGGERRVNVEFDASPAFMMGFHKPVPPGDDDYIFSVIDTILSHGRTARFDKTVVRQKKVALSAGVFTAPGDKFPNLFVISGEPRPPHTTEDVEKAVWEELEKLKKTPVSREELDKVVNNMESDFIHGLASHYGMARLLSHYQLVRGDWREAIREMEKIRAVTPEEIQRVAVKYFVKGNATTATLVNKK